jgi:Cellulase (glycosyl hydrolase family 5)
VTARRAIVGFLLAVAVNIAPTQAQVRPSLIGTATNGTPCEFRVSGVPNSPAPFDPDAIRVDAQFSGPDGGRTMVPAFWFQEYTRAVLDGTEVLTARGSPEWRVRFLPGAAGSYAITVLWATNGHSGSPSQPVAFTVGAGASPIAGVARVSASGTDFVNGDGTPLALIGANICWPGSRGTYDYDDWLPALATNHGNYARIWMAPWEFGIETAPGTLVNYRLDRAWKLDRIFKQAESLGIRLMLCLDYHGMFATQPDPTWGGGDNWKVNPYNAANGGPCANPNAFFTNTIARATYQKRLRHLVARYAASPALFSWEFLNEIDNVYYTLQPADVAAWHAANGAWLKAQDPWRHLVTTSTTGGSDRPELWKLPEIDFVQYHSYNEPSPAEKIASVTRALQGEYGKPVVIGEFGVDFRGWMRSADPFLRGFRQGLWGGVLGGSTGTSMSWWWENLHSEKVYPLHGVVHDILARTRWRKDAYVPVSFVTSGPPPSTVGDQTNGGAPFNVTLIPSTQWGGKPTGHLAVPDADAADFAVQALNCFLQGTAHPNLRTPLVLNAWFAVGARVVPHVNSVSFGAKLGVLIDGRIILSKELPDRDGLTNPTVNEYNIDVPVDVSPGLHTIELRNLGSDWLYLDYVRLEQVAHSTYSDGWQASPSAIGLKGPRDALVYVVAPRMEYPSQATNSDPAVVHGGLLKMTNWPSGSFAAQWYSPTNAAVLGETRGIATNGALALPIPNFIGDAAGVVFPVPSVSGPQPAPEARLRFETDGPNGYPFVVEESANLADWVPGATSTFTVNPTAVLEAITNQSRFFRVRIPP